MGRTACTEPQCLYKGALYLNKGNGTSREDQSAIFDRISLSYFSNEKCTQTKVVDKTKSYIFTFQ
jgi:hypothetical protein